jgi:hypothetical protein
MFDAALLRNDLAPTFRQITLRRRAALGSRADFPFAFKRMP